MESTLEQDIPRLEMFDDIRNQCERWREEGRTALAYFAAKGDKEPGEEWKEDLEVDDLSDGQSPLQTG